MTSLFNSLKSILGPSWSIIIILSSLGLILHIIWLKKNKQEISFLVEFPLFCFFIYFLSLFHIVTSQDVSNIGGINITFFKEIRRYAVGSSLFYRNIVGNICLFLPFGFFLDYLFQIKKKFYIIILMILVSLMIETMQLSIGRSFDVDDIILNIIGGILGFILYKLLNYILLKLKIKEGYQNVIIMIILLIIMISVFVVMW